jgi:hypothetical protein
MNKDTVWVTPTYHSNALQALLSLHLPRRIGPTVPVLHNYIGWQALEFSHHCIA